MSGLLGAQPFRLGEAPDFAPLRAALQRAGYAEAGINEVLEGRNEQNVDLAVALHRTAPPTAFNTLVRLFTLHLTLPSDAVRSAIAPAEIEELLAVGVVERVEDGIRATARLRPWRDLLLLNDFLPTAGERLPADFVMSGASSSSMSLAAMTVRRPVESALDLGTGSGVHALLAAQHAERVVATDANPRALNFTAINARLNGIGNVSVVEGSFFEPVGGECFDLIVANPPFVIAPPSDLLFQGTGLAGDAVSERVVREAPAHLNEGGYAISLVSWPHGGGGDWSERPRSWAWESGCDLWLLRAADEDPLSYAASALRQTEPAHGPRYAAMLDAWLDYYREQGFVRMAIGAAILRKRSAAEHWARCDAIPTTVHGRASDQIQRIFAAEDLLATIETDERLLDLKLALHPEHRLEQELAMQDGSWDIKSAILSATRGIAFRARLDSRLLPFLALCDGRRSLREVFAAMEQDSEPSAERMRTVRQMLRKGVLVPA